MRNVSGDEVLAMPVLLHGLSLGRPADLLLDRETLRVVGLDVLCGDEVHRFLPLPTAAIGDDGLTIHSPLVLLEADELDFYRARAFALSSLRGRAVTRNAKEVGRLRDVVFGVDGQVRSLVFESGERIPFDDTLALAQRRTAA
jgi:hypothetical protein